MMGRRFWVGVLALLSIAIVGCNTCLNPQPDLPSCGESDSARGLPGGGRFGRGGAGSSAAGASTGGTNGYDVDPGAAGTSSESAAGTGGSSDDSAGAGGDSAGEPGGSDGGAAGADSAAGAAGNQEL